MQRVSIKYKANYLPEVVPCTVQLPVAADPADAAARPDARGDVFSRAAALCSLPFDPSQVEIKIDGELAGGMLMQGFEFKLRAEDMVPRMLVDSIPRELDLELVCEVTEGRDLKRLLGLVTVLFDEVIAKRAPGSEEFVAGLRELCNRTC